MPQECLQTDFTQQLDLSPLEREVLALYQTLAVKLYKLSDEIQKIHQKSPEKTLKDFVAGQALALLRNMHGLERKFGLVYTLFRTAVYSLQLQNEEVKEQSDTGHENRWANSDSVDDLETHVRQLLSEDEATSMLPNDPN